MATEPPQDVTETSGGNLCATCAVIPFNDELVASFIKTQDLREPSWDITAAAGFYPDRPEYEVGWSRYPLGYNVVDFLPSLPCLERSALGGCDFCSLLRLEIIQAEYEYTGYVQITLAYGLGGLRFPGLGVAALVAELTWRPDIPSIPPASPKPNKFRNCIIFAIESDNVDVASWLKVPRLRKEDPLCEENIQFMTDELANCVLNCNHYRATDFLPSRLLDLGSQKRLDSIRLIDSSQLVSTHERGPPKYAALSYCWGSTLATDGVEQVRAEVGSVESMRRHVPQRGIPPVTLDAIKVCKALSIRYLWVDSLCIIQDDISDWESESASMTLIYSNAFVTISTPSSTASSQGFLVRHRKHIAVPFQSRVVPSIKGTYNLVASGTCNSLTLYGWPSLDVFHTSWDRRGWTLQESEMSNRLLIFGKSMVHFECRHTVSENGYHQERSLDTRMVRVLDDHNSDRKILSKQWTSLLIMYHTRLFTFVQDRLPGISGMAKYIAERTGDEYLAGLWKTELPSSLLWYELWYDILTLEKTKYHVELPNLLDMLHSPTPYIAPSWSPLRLDAGVDAGVEPRTLLRLLSLSQLSAESNVVDASVVSVGKNPFGRVQHVQIRMQGKTMPVLSELAKLRCGVREFQWFNWDRGVITYYQLDWVPAEETCNRGKLLMLLIASTETTSSFHTMDMHGGSLEAAHHCCGKDPVDLTESSSAGSESEVDNHSDEFEIKDGSPLPTNLAVAQSSEEVGTEAHTQTDADGGDKLIEGALDRDESCTSSEERPWTSRVNNRTAYGLLVHHLLGTDTYVRVGLWMSMPEDGGGTALFEDMDVREIDIV